MQICWGGICKITGYICAVIYRCDCNHRDTSEVTLDWSGWSTDHNKAEAVQIQPRLQNPPGMAKCSSIYPVVRFVLLLPLRSCQYFIGLLPEELQRFCQTALALCNLHKLFVQPEFTGRVFFNII